MLFRQQPGIGDDIEHGAGKKPKLKKHVDYSEKIDNVFAMIGSHKNMFADFGEMIKTIDDTPAPLRPHRPRCGICLLTLVK
jgi:hypothetical protein